jgi:hypothetical protein
MSDDHCRFRMILKSLKALHPEMPQGNSYRHLVTLAALINGIIASKSCQLPAVAAKVPFLSKLESTVKKFSRWLQNDDITYNTFFLPYATVLLNCLYRQTLAIVFDGSLVGRDCITLMASVIYKNRSLPLCWITLRGKKGHLSEAIHVKLAQQLMTIIPEQATVVFLGDGEFDGANLIKTIHQNKWFFVSRTAKNRILIEDHEPFHLEHIDRCYYEEHIFIPSVRFNQDSDIYFNALMWWGKGYKEPIYLLTNIELAREAMYWYKKRFLIETMFSDQKSRGFNIHKSHLSDPARLSSLLIATCIAYILIVYFGILALKNGLNNFFHRHDRCDLSLFQLGLRAIEYQLNRRKLLKQVEQLSLFQFS